MKSEEFQLIMKRLEAIEEKATRPDQKPEDIWWDHQQLTKFLNISKRTAQNYRDRGWLKFTMPGSKIWYNKADVLQFLRDHAVIIKGSSDVSNSKRS